VPYLYKSAAPINFLIPPFAYIYIRSVLRDEQKFKVTDYIHFIPAVLVFETNSLTESWNGLVNGKQAPLETYAWSIACVDADGKLLLRKGMVTMIRD
jgi:hypothetical protein